MGVPLVEVVMALELVPTSKRLFVSDIHQGNVGQSRYGTPSNRTPVQAAFDRGRPRLATKVCQGQDYKSNGHRVRRCDMWLGPWPSGPGSPALYKGSRLWAVPQG